MNRLLRGLGPALPRPHLAEALRAGAGAALGLALAALVLQRSGMAGAGLIAPFGASAFLIFAVPNSPLAQPWSAIVGSAVSALVAAAVLHLPLPVFANAALAVGAAILAMAATRSMHPPAGAVALLVVLSADPAAPPGPFLALSPVAEGAAVLVLAGILWNRLTGRVYPFRQPAAQGPHGTADPAADRRLGLRPDDLRMILDRLRLSPNLGPEDLGRALEQAEVEATARHLGALAASDIMSRDVIAVAPGTPAAQVAQAFLSYGFNTLPLCAPDGGLAGLIDDRALIGANPEALAESLAHPVTALPPQAGLADLLPLLSDGHQQSVPIVEAGRLIGIVTRSDLITLLAAKIRTQDEPA
jgi:CBS domain-containing membrane protein